MRELVALAVVACATGCADLTEPAPASPPPVAPAAENASGDEVVGTSEVGGGVTVATGSASTEVAAATPGSDGAGDPPGAGDDECGGGGAVCMSDAAFWACMGVCTTAASLSCQTLLSVCVAGETATLGTTTIPCGIGIVAACVGSVACMVGCTR